MNDRFASELLWCDHAIEAFVARHVTCGQICLILTQAPVWNRFEALWQEAGRSCFQEGSLRVHLIPDREACKTFEVYAQVCDHLLSLGFSREDRLLAFGGGTVGDLTGFAAATVLRGMDWSFIPTTLLAQQDASVGGKTGINVAQGKNLIGAFWAPETVYFDRRFLDTLPEVEFWSGYMEWLKHGILKGDPLYTTLLAFGLTGSAGEVLDNVDLFSALREGVATKRDIVAADYRESGPRQLLNLGHTFGHVLESQSHFTLPHGLCVGLGLAFVTFFSERLFPGTDWRALREVIKARCRPFIPQESVDLKADGLRQRLAFDKKKARDSVTWLMPKAPGQVLRTLRPLEDPMLADVLAEWEAWWTES